MSLSDAPDVLTVPEAAAILRIGRNQAYELVRSGELRSVRLGNRTIRVPRVALTEFLDVNVEPNENAPGLGGVLLQIPPDSDDHPEQ
jgi:excisionase family DNA binding protein